MTTERSRLTKHVNSSTGSYELALSAVVLGLLGLWLDTRLGTTPLLTVALTVLGFVGAGLSLYYRYRAEISRINAETAELRKGMR